MRCYGHTGGWKRSDQVVVHVEREAVSVVHDTLVMPLVVCHLKEPRKRQQRQRMRRALFVQVIFTVCKTYFSGMHQMGLTLSFPDHCKKKFHILHV